MNVACVNKNFTQVPGQFETNKKKNPSGSNYFQDDTKFIPFSVKKNRLEAADKEYYSINDLLPMIKQGLSSEDCNSLLLMLQFNSTNPQLKVSKISATNANSQTIVTYNIQIKFPITLNIPSKQNSANQKSNYTTKILNDQSKKFMMKPKTDIYNNLKELIDHLNSDKPLFLKLTSKINNKEHIQDIEVQGKTAAIANPK